MFALALAIGICGGNVGSVPLPPPPFGPPPYKQRLIAVGGRWSGHGGHWRWWCCIDAGSVLALELAVGGGDVGCVSSSSSSFCSPPYEQRLIAVGGRWSGCGVSLGSCVRDHNVIITKL